MFASRIVEATIEEWIVETTAWTVRQFGGPGWLAERALVLPTDAFFERRDDAGHERAARLFAAVKKHAGMSEWECELVALDGAAPGELGELAFQVPAEAPLGTFRPQKDATAPVITYSADLLDDPHGLIATFAHELAHLRMSAVEEPAPQGWEVEELATDLAAVVMGFGVFLANSAFTFEQFQGAGRQGWRAERRGYLSEGSLTFATALFMRLRDIPEDAAKPYLEPHLAALLKRAFARIDKAKLCEAVRARRQAA